MTNSRLTVILNNLLIGDNKNFSVWFSFLFFFSYLLFNILYSQVARHMTSIEDDLKLNGAKVLYLSQSIRLTEYCQILIQIKCSKTRNLIQEGLETESLQDRNSK